MSLKSLQSRQADKLSEEVDGVTDGVCSVENALTVKNASMVVDENDPFEVNGKHDVVLKQKFPLP